MIGKKNVIRLASISIVAFCAVFVCTLFLNYNMDFMGIKDEIDSPQAFILYDAQVMTGKVVSGVSGGCLLVTSMIMLLFYIKNHIDTHKKELGIMKALGYSEFRIALQFWTFALSVFAGTALGFGGAFLMMPTFYETQLGEGIFPDVEITFHPQLAAAMVVLPTVFFGVLSVAYAYLKLRMPTVDLLKERLSSGRKPREKALIFFAIFGAFCYSAMVQMSSRMNEFSEGLMVVMIFVIGIILAGITLLMALTTVVKRNTKNIAMMRVLGYSFAECRKAVLSKYRVFAYLGFVLGTLYQHLLLKIMINIVFQDVEGVPDYNFNMLNCFYVLISFAILYEGILYGYGRRIRKVSVKEVMLE